MARERRWADASASPSGRTTWQAAIQGPVRTQVLTGLFAPQDKEHRPIQVLDQRIGSKVIVAWAEARPTWD